jgi:hypothetical protein
MKARSAMKSLFLAWLCVLMLSTVSRAGPFDLYVIPDRPTSFDQVVGLLVGSLDPSCSRVDSVYCERVIPSRLEMHVLVVITQPMCLAFNEPFAETCVYGDLAVGDYTLIAKTYVGDFSGPPSLIDSLTFEVRPPTATRQSSWGYVRGLFR